ncbi:MAG: DUF11 domain-containing protein [Deltaproteobacteria bacterium]|nr:DUF11 domain-containing protein [Deltaproteobacteria bacterium]
MGPGRTSRQRSRALWTLAPLLLALLPATPARAFVDGTYPSQPLAFKVYGKAVQLGASLVTNFTDYRYNDKLLPSSSDSVQASEKLPEDAIIVGAYLFWGGSAFGSSNNPQVDQTVTLTAADGAAISVTADACDTRAVPNNFGVDPGAHFYCRKDVTSLIAAHPGLDAYNGTYTVGDVNARVASITSNCGGLLKPNPSCSQPETVCCAPSDPFCQARHASWSLVLIYDTKASETTQRDIFLYPGFVLLDEQETTTGQQTINLSGIFVGDPPQAQLSYHVMEGDKQLGNPYQDPPGGCDSPPCTTCFDFISFGGTKLTGGAGNNDANNIFNSTPETSLDLDTFDVSNLLKPEQTSASILVSSGNGSIADNTPNATHGYGELILYGYTLMQINRLAPSFKNPITKYTVNATEAAPGEVLTYTIDLLNTGQLDANPTVAKLDVFPPPGTEYVAGSTVVEGVVQADVGGKSPLQTGLSLGNVSNPAGGNSARKVSFKVRVLQNPPVADIVSTAALDYTYKGTQLTFTDSVQTNTTTVKITAPKLATPLLVVSPSSAAPGESVTYTLTLENATGADVAVDSFEMPMPPEVLFQGANGPGTNQSAASGGANGTGFARFATVLVPAGGKVSFTISAKVRTVAELQQLGIGTLNGHAVAAQAKINLGTKVLSSDDPNKPGDADPTVFSLDVLSNLAASSKEGKDLSADTPLLPGDEMQFNIVIVNAGPGDAVVNVTDPLPSALEFVSSPEPEVQHAGGVVTASGLQVGAGQTRTLLFTAKVRSDTPASTKLTNVATLSPADGSPPKVVQTGVFTVTGGPDLASSSKTVVDLNGGDIEPGDTLRYTILLTNSGKLPTGAIELKDPLPSSLESVSNIVGGGNFDAGSNSVIWSLPSLSGNGGKVVLGFDAKIKATVTNGTTIENIATAKAAEMAQPVPVSVAVLVSASPNVSVFDLTVAADKGQFVPGAAVTWTLSLQNTGKGPVLGPTVTLPIDALVKIDSVAGSGSSFDGQTVTWKPGDLTNGLAPQVLLVKGTIAAVVPQGSAVAAQATLSGAGLGIPIQSDNPATPVPDDATSFTITSAPQIVLSKSFADANGGIAQGGDGITFTISVRNDGNAPATNLVVQDTLHTALEQVAVQNGSFDATTRVVSWAPIASLAPGAAPIELVVGTVIAKSTPSKTVVQNIATAAFDETPKTATSNSVSFEVENLPDFGRTTKAVSAAVIQAGEAVEWTIEVENSGNLAGSGVVVSDKVDPQLTDVEVVGGSFDATSRVATWQVGTLAAGAKASLTLRAKVVKPLGSGVQICNQAEVKAQENPTASLSSPPGGTFDGSPTCFEVASAPKLVIEKRALADPGGQVLNGGLVKPETALRYEVRVRNVGNAVAENLIVTDVVSPLLIDVEVEGGGSFDDASRTITWDEAPSLGIGTNDVLVRTFRAKVDKALDNGLPIPNQAAVQHKDGGAAPQLSDDPTTPAEGDATVLTVISNIDFSKATKSVVDNNGGDVRPGDTLTYTIDVRNEGDATGKAVVIDDPIDDRFVDVKPLDGGVLLGSGSGKVVRWTVGELAPGEGVKVRVEATLAKPLADGVVIPNQAFVTAQGFAAPIATDSKLGTPERDPTTVAVVATVDLSLSVWSVTDENGGTVEPGDMLVFALKLKNSGDALATATQVQAILGQGQLQDVFAFDGGTTSSSTGGEIDKIDWTVPLIGLSPTGDVELRLRAKVAEGLQDGAKITVAANIPGVVPPPEITVIVDTQPNLSSSVLAVDDESGWVVKVGQTGPGHVLRYELLLQNTGKAAATSLVVNLPLPAAFASVDAVGGSVTGKTASWTIATLPAGGKATLTAKATLATTIADGTVLAPIANAQSPDLAEPLLVPAQAVVVLSRPILTLKKVAEDTSGEDLFPGDTVRFQLTAANVGTAAATPLTLRDDLTGKPLTDVQPQAGGAMQGQVATWSIPSLQPGQTVTVSLLAKLAKGTPSGGTLVNVGNAEAAGADAVVSNSAQLEVAYPTLAVAAAYLQPGGATGPVQPGDEIELRVEVSADGDRDARGVQVLAPIDTSVFEVVEVSGGSFDAGAKVAVWKPADNAGLQNLAAGKTASLSAKLKVRATAAHEATVATIVTAREGQTGITWQSPAATASVVSVPKLAIDKRVQDLDGGKVLPLDTLRYELTVRVEGEAAAKNVEIRDALPQGLELVAIGEGGAVQGGVVVWNAQTTPALAEIAPGKTAVLKLEVRVGATVGDGEILANQALGQATAMPAAIVSDDPETADPLDPTAVKVRVATALGASSKSVTDVNGAPLLVGDVLRWRIAVIATSNQAINGATLIDPIPAGTAYVAGSTRVNGVAVADAASGSPLATGLLVQSPGAAEGVVEPGTDKAAIVEFETRVLPSAAEGTRIDNLATATAQGVPPTPIGPAGLPVGKGPSLARFAKRAELFDQDGDGLADPGEEIRFVLTVRNDGQASADEVVVRDPIPSGTSLVPGTLVLDGKARTDAVDGDAAEQDSSANPPAVRFRIGEVVSGAVREASFRVRVEAGAVAVVNQAIADAKGLPETRSDGDDDDSNGDQPTVVGVDGGKPALVASKTVADENGGTVRGGDFVRYTIRLRNAGNEPLNQLSLADPLPEGLATDVGAYLLPPGASAKLTTAAQGPGLLEVTGLAVGDGEEVTIGFRARVAEDAAPGSTICNEATALIARVSPDGRRAPWQVPTGRACVTVGATIGQASARGFVFEDRDAQDGIHGAGDLPFAGWQVVISAPDGEGGVASAITETDGSFRIAAMPSGKRRVRVRSPHGAVFLDATFDAAPGEQVVLPLALRPTGRIYDARKGTPVAGVRAFLFYDDADPLAPGKLVPQAELPEGQQGQRVDATGAYVFQPKNGRIYRVDVSAAGVPIGFPSNRRAAEAGIARLTGDGFVDAAPLPVAGAGTPYWTRFTLQGATGKNDESGDPVPPRRNHLPVDLLADAIAISLHLSRQAASVGEIVHATVTLENRSNIGITASPLDNNGGAVLRATLPRGLGLVPSSIAASLQEKGAERGSRVSLAPAKGPLLELRRAGPDGAPLGLDLPAGARLVARFAVVVGPDAKLGQFREPRAQLFTLSGSALTHEAKGRLLVQADPLFDRGTVLAKVFCDEDGDGWQDQGEPGLPGARVYADNGHYADSDAAGRMHLVDLEPGNHLFKLDPDTLPPGSTMTTDGKRVLWISRGVGLSLRFGVRCALETVQPETVRLAPEKKAEAAAQEKGPGVVRISGELGTLALSVDGKELPAMRVRAVLAHPGVDKPAELPEPQTPSTVAATAPLTLHVVAEGRFDRHTVEIRGLDRESRPRDHVWSGRFGGGPPERMVLRLPAGTLRNGGRYAVQVRGGTAYGAGASSAWIAFRAGPEDSASPLPWQMAHSEPRVHINGNEVAVAGDAFSTEIDRPADGRVLVGLRNAAGARRDAYMTLRDHLPADRVTPPELGPAPTTAAPASVVVPSSEPPEPEPSKPEPVTPAPAPPEPSTPEPVAPAPAPAEPEPAAPTPAPAKPAPVAPSPTPAPVEPTAAAPTPAPVAPAQPAPTAPQPAAVAPAVTRPTPAPAGPRFARIAVNFDKPIGIGVGGTQLLPTSGSAPSLRAPDAALPIAGGMLLAEPVLQVAGMFADAKEAAVVLLDREGKVLLRSPVDVPVPETFVWSPPSGTKLVSGEVGIALEVLREDGGGLVGWRSQPRTLRLREGGPELVPDGAPDRVVRADLFEGDGKVNDSLGDWLGRAAKKFPGDDLLIVSLHRRGQDAEARTRSAVAPVRKLLQDAGVAPNRLIVLAAGSALADSDPEGWRLGADRVEIRRRTRRYGATGGAGARPYTVAAGLWVDGEPVLGDASGRAPDSIRVRVGAPSLIELQQDDGKAVLWKRVFARNPGAGAAPASPVPEQREEGAFGEAVVDQLRAELDAPATARAGASDKKKATKEAKAGAEAADEAAPAAKTNGTAPDASVEAAGRELPRADAGDVGAAELALRMPKEGATLGAERVAVSGKTRPGNVLTINGQKVQVGTDGTFSHLCELPVGKAKVEVRVRDVAGNEAAVVRNYVVKDRAFFLLAVAEGAIGQVGARVQGMTDRTSVEAGGMLLHGRGAVYLKGRIQGKFLGFEKVRYTAHLDTSKDPDLQDFRSNLFDPERFYPVYGDASIDVQDAQSRGPLYVLIEADRSRLRVGNFRTGIDGWELVRYDRALYGGMLDLERVFGGQFDTRLKLYGSSEERSLSRRTDMMRGTGGSLFYLSGRDALDGSEKVWIVVRDRDNGIELGRIPMSRNVDYTIDYREGRIVFKAPVNSAVDAFFVAGQAGMPGQHLHWNGHPVYVLATYESRAADAVGGTNVGVLGEERLLGGKVRLGGSYVHEARDGSTTPSYQLAGAHAEVRMGEKSRLRAEYAWSNSRDSLVSVSDDGGLTFGRQRDLADTAIGSAVSGHAVALVLEADLGDVAKALGIALPKTDLSNQGVVTDPTVQDPKAKQAATQNTTGQGHIRAHYRWVQQGFHSNGVLTEQGQQKVGVDTRVALSTDNALSLRYDGILTGARLDPFGSMGLGAQSTLGAGSALAPQWGSGSAATSGSFSPWGRHMVTAQDLHRLSPRWRLLTSASWTAAADAQGTTRHGVVLAEGASWQATQRLTLRGEQQLILGGDPGQYRSQYLDHMQTVVGLDWRLWDNLTLTLAERIGWGGQNATMAGVRTSLSDSTNLYVQQRLEDSYQTGRPMSATVIGAESRYGKDGSGRAWGEYQVDALNAGRMNRAVMGIGKRFVFAPGLHLDAGYERSQTFSGPTGETSRDALSLGGEWLRSGQWKLTSRQEVRVDQGDAAFGGVRKLQLVTLNAAEVQATRELLLFGRANYLRTEDQTRDRKEAETLQATLGWAFRPRTHDWFNLIGRYTRLVEMRPSGDSITTGSTTQAGAGQPGDALTERSTKHIFAIEPIVELPFGLQWSHKLALRHAEESIAAGPMVVSDTWLGISRLGYHMTSRLDVAAEYRVLITTASHAWEHGALVEAAWIFARTLRVGAGWNFTRFQETLAGDFVRDEGGFFLRVLGMY